MLSYHPLALPSATQQSLWKLWNGSVEFDWTVLSLRAHILSMHISRKFIWYTSPGANMVDTSASMWNESQCRSDIKCRAAAPIFARQLLVRLSIFILEGLISNLPSK